LASQQSGEAGGFASGVPPATPVSRAPGARHGPCTCLGRRAYDPLHDDLIAVAALALVEGKDAAAEVQRFRSQEVSWGRKTAALIGDPEDR
jgi:hypothetical protein